VSALGKHVSHSCRPQNKMNSSKNTRALTVTVSDKKVFLTPTPYPGALSLWRK
jgi:hypothetical protein